MAVLNKGEFAMNIKKNIIVSMTMIILTLGLQGTISSAVEMCIRDRGFAEIKF